MSANFKNSTHTGNVIADVVTTNSVVIANGVLTVAHIPTADPHVAGQVYSNNGVLTVSAG